MEIEGQAAIDRANFFVSNSNHAEFSIRAYDGDLLLLGSFDLAYYHTIELEFRDVLFINFPTFQLGALHFAIADSDARSAHAHLDLDDNEILFEITDDPGFSDQRYYIVASKLLVREGMVYHYQRDNLKDGERIAPWVKP